MVDTVPKPFVFVLMPFDEGFDDVYQLGIKKACDNVGAYAERIDEQIFGESILQRIYNQIAKADVVVADMTGRNPNVFYETGYAHALGKQVILLTQDVNDIPFDLKHYPHIVYGGSIVGLMPDLEKKVKWAIEQAEKQEAPLGPLIQFYVGDVSLTNTPTLDFVLLGPQAKSIWLKFFCHNPDDREIQYMQFEVAFITSDSFSHASLSSDAGGKSIPLPKGGFIHVLGGTISLLPGGWESFTVRFRSSGNLPSGSVETIILRALSEEGGHDYPFNVSLLPPP